MKTPRTYRLLFVDDDDIFAMLFRESIAEHADLCESFVIDRVSDGDEALDYLLNGNSKDGADVVQPDVILLDQRMPRMDGTAVLLKLRNNESTRAIPVCMLSTSNQANKVESCLSKSSGTSCSFSLTSSNCRPRDPLRVVASAIH